MADVPIVVCTAGKGRVIFSRPESGLKIGRAAENDIVFDDDGVSRFHASLILDNGTLWLRDAVGVFVNGQRVMDQCALKVGDELTISLSILLLFNGEVPRWMQIQQILLKKGQRIDGSGHFRARKDAIEW